MNNIGAHEVFLPTLQKKEQWLETKRWNTMEPPLFKFKDRHGRELALAPTHEEVITDLARRFIQSYRDLPLALYQIQNKFRNEMRATGGLLRVKEFVMKDLYSFHETEDDLVNYFEKIKDAYHKIFKCCRLTAIPSMASGGTIGGTTTYEFQVPSPAGEDKILFCKDCRFAVTKGAEEIVAGQVCPQCKKANLEEISAIEIGHIFNLGTEYSEKMGATFTDAKGKQKPIWMGCYGIGLGRLMAAIVEVHHDDKGIIWPKAVAPYQIHLLAINIENPKVVKKTKDLYEELQEKRIEVLYDDRVDVSAGEKLAVADLIGIPTRLVVSEESLKERGVEVKERNKKEAKIVSLEEFLK